MKQSNNILLGACLMAAMVGCGQEADPPRKPNGRRTSLPKMLQGVWIDSDDEDDVAFRVKGDAIYYPDSTSRPVYFCIIGDTLVMKAREYCEISDCEAGGTHLPVQGSQWGCGEARQKDFRPMYLEQLPASHSL